MGFDQLKLHTKYSNLNCNDLVVLRTIIDLIPRIETKIQQDNKEYSWIMYKLLVEVCLSESTMKKIVQKLINAGLIERLLINKNGKYTYFRKTKDCCELEYVQNPESIEVMDTSCKKSNNNLDKRTSKKIVHTLNNKSNLRFINFKSREYDYDLLEKKLLGWDDDFSRNCLLYALIKTIRV